MRLAVVFGEIFIHNFSIKIFTSYLVTLFKISVFLPIKISQDNS